MPISSIVIPVIVNVPSEAVVVDAPGRSLAASSVTCTTAPPTGNPVALSRTRALKFDEVDVVAADVVDGVEFVGVVEVVDGEESERPESRMVKKTPTKITALPRSSKISFRDQNIG